MEPNTARAEAERWLGISAKLLAARDLAGSRSFAIRARESDPTNPISDQILAVVDTLLAAEKRVINTSHHDWYSILQLSHLVCDPDLIASQYRRLVLLLNPDQNHLPFADFAFRAVVDAWSVLSDPTKKWLYDSELSIFLQRSSAAAPPESVRVESAAAAAATYQFFQPPPQSQAQQHQQWIDHLQDEQPPPPPPQLQERQLFQQQHRPQPTPPPPPPQQHQWLPQSQQLQQQQQQRSSPPQWMPQPPQPQPQPQIPPQQKKAPPEQQDRERNGERPESNDENVEGFWTACPYCYYLYEYAKTFQDCTLRCQNCRRAFHGLEIPNSPGNACRGGETTNFCSWGFFPIGFSMASWKKSVPFGGESDWVPQGVKKKVWRIVDEDEVDFHDLDSSEDDSDSSDDDWGRPGTYKKRKVQGSVRGGRGGGRGGRKSNVAEREKMGNQHSVGVAVAERKAQGNTNHVGSGMKNDLKKQTGKGVRGRKKLDLNVEFSNEVEDHAPVTRESRDGNGGEEVVEFFEGLDEFLKTLPILDPVGDDKAKPS